MANVVTGTRDTRNINQSKLVVDMSNEIALLDPNESPFMSFLKIAKSRVRTVYNPKFEWMEDGLLPRWDAVNNAAGYADNATAIVVDNALYFRAGDVVKVPRTDEVMLVTAVDTGTNTLTVIRGYGTTTAAALVDNDPLLIIGDANAEGAGSREIKTTQVVPKYNYTQIFKTPIAVTGTEAATKMYGGPDLAYQRKKAGVQHKIDMARSFILGERKEEIVSGKPRRTTGGLLSFLTQNNYDAGGALTKAEFDNNLSEVVFKHGSKEKILLCSARLLSVINQWAEGHLQVDNLAEKFGLKIYTYVTPFGTYKLMNEQRILEGAVYGGYGIIVDPAKVSYCPMNGRDTRLETNIQLPDADEEKDQYITEAGLEVRNPECHGVITGVTSAA